MMMSVRLIPLLILTVICALFVLGLAHQRSANVLSLAPVAPRPVPQLTADRLGQAGDAKAESFDLKTLSGRWILVNFFSSWCIPCAAENEDIKHLSDDMGKRLSIVGIAYKDKPAAITDWLAKRGNPYGVVGFDPDGTKGIDWGITGVPESFLINPRYQIIWHIAGPLNARMIKDQIMSQLDNPDAQTP